MQASSLETREACLLSRSLDVILIAASQHLERLPEPPAFLDEIVRRSDIEFDPFEVGWYEQFRPGVFRQVRRLASEQIGGYTYRDSINRALALHLIASSP